MIELKNLASVYFILMRTLSINADSILCVYYIQNIGIYFSFCLENSPMSSRLPFQYLQMSEFQFAFLVSIKIPLIFYNALAYITSNVCLVMPSLYKITHSLIPVSSFISLNVASFFVSFWFYFYPW